MQDTICSAIEAGDNLEFDYEKHHRIVTPLILFRSQDGDTSIGGPQVGGSSESGNMSYWRTFNLDKIDSLTVQNKENTVHGSDQIMPDTVEKYNPDSEKYEEVICAKDPSEL